MNAETIDLIKSLMLVVNAVLEGDDDDRQIAATAYLEAQQLIAASPGEGDVSSRIAACMERSNAYVAANDIARAGGWVLAALEVRANGRQDPDWRQLEKVIDEGLKLLPLADTIIH